MNKKLLLYGLPVLILLAIFYPLFQASFAYLDDFHLLWHNEKGNVFNICFIHGRYLYGLMLDKAFNSSSTIGDIRTYRILSVIGWAVALLVYVRVAIAWARMNLIDNRVVLMSAVYMAGSLTVAISNGWGGTCFTICLSFITGLLSGHVLYSQLYKHKNIRAVPILMQLLAVALGVVSLFIYQIGIGLFLIPFFLHFNNHKFEKPDRTLITGVIAMLVTVAVYYGVYQLQLKIAGAAPPERTALELNIFKKISFFFGVPTAQAFSFNFLFNMRSIVSQLFYIVTIAVWVLHTFVTQRNKPVVSKIIYLALTFALLMLIYLPVMVTVENFSSYRSMLALNLAAVLMLLNMAVQWIKPAAWKTRFAIASIVIFAAVGFSNFHQNFLTPVLKEYQVVRSAIEKQYTPAITKVYFLRAPEDLYKQQFHIHYYRDEFGVPLTFKDWVPEPFTKQVIYEITHDKAIGQKTEVVMFPYEEAEAFNKQVALKEPNAMAIDAAALFNSSK